MFGDQMRKLTQNSGTWGSGIPPGFSKPIPGSSWTGSDGSCIDQSAIDLAASRSSSGVSIICEDRLIQALVDFPAMSSQLMSLYQEDLLSISGRSHVALELSRTEPYPGARHSCLIKVGEIQAIVDGIKQELGGVQLRPLDHAGVRDRLNPDSTSGFPDYKQQREILRSSLWKEYIPELTGVSTDLCRPLTQYFRLQHRPTGVKLRSVMGYPMCAKVLEAQYSYPLQDWLRTQPFSASGRTKAQQGQMINDLRNGCDTVLSLDVDSFDQSMPTPIIRGAFDVAFSLFGSSASDTERAIIQNYFLFSQMVRRDGSVLVRNGGIPSGSQFTSVIGTLCNYICYRYMLQSLGSEVRATEVKILSDDILMGFNSSLAPSRLKNRVIRMYEELGLS